MRLIRMNGREYKYTDHQDRKCAAAAAHSILNEASREDVQEELLDPFLIIIIILMH